MRLYCISCSWGLYSNSWFGAELTRVARDCFTLTNSNCTCFFCAFSNYKQRRNKYLRTELRLFRRSHALLPECFSTKYSLFRLADWYRDCYALWFRVIKQHTHFYVATCSVHMYSNFFKQISPCSAFTLHIIDIPLHLPVSEPCRLIYPCRFHFFWHCASQTWPDCCFETLWSLIIFHKSCQV